jgi:hypothetical protein
MHYLDGQGGSNSHKHFPRGESGGAASNATAGLDPFAIAMWIRWTWYR